MPVVPLDVDRSNRHNACSSTRAHRQTSVMRPRRVIDCAAMVSVSTSALLISLRVRSTARLQQSTLELTVDQNCIAQESSRRRM